MLSHLLGLFLSQFALFFSMRLGILFGLFLLLGSAYSQITTSAASASTTPATPYSSSVSSPVVVVGRRSEGPVICSIRGFVANSTAAGFSCQPVKLENGSDFTSVSCSGSMFAAGIQSPKAFRNGFLSGSHSGNFSVTTGFEGGINSVTNVGGSFLLSGKFRNSPSILDPMTSEVYPMLGKAAPPTILASLSTATGFYFGGFLTAPLAGVVRTVNGSAFSATRNGLFGGVTLKGMAGVVYALGVSTSPVSQGAQIYVGGAFDAVGGSTLAAQALAIFDESTSAWITSGGRKYLFLLLFSDPLVCEFILFFSPTSI